MNREMRGEDLARVRSALGSQYDIRRELGSGGMGTVFLAHDIKHNREVAVKVLRPELAATVGATRFLREISIEAQLQHPNILPLHDSGESESCVYYVMPYVAGESLRERLDREPQLRFDDALRILREVADALSCAHRHGIVHRDIKPENILLSEGHAFVADFGIARGISEAGGERITESGHAIGTPAYMSPEQAGGDTVLDCRSDIYSLGCVTYEMLAGEPPFGGRSAQAILAKHILEPPPALAIVRPAAPRTVVEAVNRTLAKTPADRFASVEEFIAALESDPATSGEEAKRSVWGGRRVVGSVALVAAALAVISTWLTTTRGVATLDPHKIVVFPLAERGVGSGEADVGWGVALAIGVALEHSRPLKWIDGWSRLPEATRLDPRLLSADNANQITQGRQAQFYIDGVAARDNGSVSVSLRLHDVTGDSLIAQETASSELGAATFPEVGLLAVRQLLPKLLDPGRTIDLSAIADRDASAIALWIQGETRYRRADFDGALDFYGRSIVEDSFLVYAAVKGAQAASWVKNDQDAKQFLSVALRNDSLLPTRYKHYARGLEAFLDGRADSAVSWLERVVAEDPDWSEASMALAEVYYHLIPSRLALDSLAEHWFGRAFANDTSFTPAVVHLAQIAIRRGDVPRAQEYVQQLRRQAVDSTVLVPLTLMLDCVRAGPEQANFYEMAAEDPGSVLLTAATLAAAGSQIECAKDAFSAILVADTVGLHKWGALLGLQGLLIAEGRSDDARGLLDSALAAGNSAAYPLYVFNTVVGVPMESGAAEAQRLAREYGGEDYENTGTLTRWLLGTWHAKLGDADKVERILQTLDTDATANSVAPDRLLADVLSAHLALAVGDTSDAISRFERLTSNVPRTSLSWGIAEPLAIERLVLAELLLSRQRYDDALAVASVFDHQEPIIFVPCLPTSLVIRLRAAEGLGNDRLVAKYRRRLTELGRVDLLRAD